MHKSLCDVIFASIKRKQVLLLLQDGAKEMEFILKSLEMTRQALLPQMKVLEEHHLVSHQKDVYQLTTIGELLVEKMAPLVGTLEVLDVDIDYWGTHDWSFLPPQFFERIKEIGECTVMSPSIENIHEAHRITDETSKKFHYSITTFFYPHFRDIFSLILSEGADMHIIISQSLFDKLKIDNYNDLKELLSNDLVHLYLYPKKMNLLAFVYNEQMVMISPLINNGSFDSKHIISEKATAINWAKDVFECYLKSSTQITEL